MSAIASAARANAPGGSIVDGLPPGPSTPAVIQTYRYVRDPLPLLDECASRFGDMFTLHLLGTLPWVFLSSPPLLKALFAAPPETVHAGEANATVFGAIAGAASVFTMDESAHLNRRRLLLPQFHGDRMQVYFDQIREIASEAAALWPSGVPFALNRQTQQMTLHAIIRAVFGIQIGRGITRISRPRRADRPREQRRRIRCSSRVPCSATGTGAHGAAWFGSSAAPTRRSIARSSAAAAPDVSDRQDILSLLLQTRAEDGSLLTDREVRDELVVMLMAGHETTGTALAWVFERVLSLPEVERGVHEELEQIVGAGPFTAAHLPQLEYLDAVVKESLRNRPIMPAGGARLVRRPFEIGGYLIPPGAILVSAMYLLHRRPEL